MIDYKDLNLTEEELDELQEQLNMRKKKELYEKHIETIENNRAYVGKCYKEKHRPKGQEKYICILSSKSSNEYRAEAMCFEFPVKIDEKHNLTKMFNPDNAFGGINFKGIYVESYPLLCNSIISRPGKVLNNLEEITQEEYFKQMDRYIKELQEKVASGEFETSKNNKSMFRR